MRIAFTALLAAGVMLAPLAASEDGHRRGAGLADVPGLEAPDLRRVADGLAVAKTLDAADPREVVVIGSIVLLLDAGGPRAGCHVIYVNRSRVKAAAGRFGSITRRVIESRDRDGLRRFLETLKARAIDAGTAP